MAVARAEHVRRRRAVTRLLSRVVPAAAGGLLLAAVVIRLSHAPLAVFWVLLASTAIALVALAWLRGRVPAVTDAAAAEMDADAQLGGELHSAHWFASHPVSGAWTAFHLDAAAERVQHVSWPSIYPPVKAARAWAGSMVLGLAAVALALSAAWPPAGWLTIAGGSRASASASAVTGRRIPADLQKQIDELLKSMGNGSLPLDTARARIGDLRDELSKLDPKLQNAMASAADGQSPKPGHTDLQTTDPDAAALASRAEKAAADEDLPGDVKWSLQDLASKLAKASRQSTDPSSQTSADAKATRADGAPPAAQGLKPTDPQTTRMTTADSQSTEMMASVPGMTGGDPQNGGADAASRKAALQPLDLSGVLKKEAVEASADASGANVLAEIRRKSEQSRSTLQFSHVAPLTAYDTSHASAPPRPPDALRPLLQQYFIRR